MNPCNTTAAASASTSSRRPRVEPPCSRITPSARAVLIRSSHSSTGSPLRRAMVSPMSRAAAALAASRPSPVSGSPTTTPTGRCSATSSRKRGMGNRLPERRTSVSSGDARTWDSSLSARPMRTSPQSTAMRRPLVGSMMECKRAETAETAERAERNCCCSLSALSAVSAVSALLSHRRKELLVVLRPLHPLQQELERLHRWHVRQEIAQEVDPVELVLVHEQLFLAGRGALDVDGGIDAPVGQAPVEDELRVAGALELLEDHLVHPAAGVDQRRRDDAEAAALVDVPRRAEEALRLLQRVGVHAAGQNLARVRHYDVVGPRQAGDRVEQDHH